MLLEDLFKLLLTKIITSVVIVVESLVKTKLSKEKKEKTEVK